MHARSLPSQTARLFPRLWLLVATTAALGAVARLCLWVAYAGAERGNELLWPALLQGLRYDLVAGAAAALLVGLLMAPLWLIGWRGRAVRWAQWMLVGVLLSFVLLSVCEHFYYAFYKTRFDPIVFGMFEDDTGAILETVWQDYPVIPGLFGLGVAALVLHWSVPRAGHWLGARWPKAGGNWGRISLLVVQCVLLVLLARGSVGTFPLVRRDVTVSADPFVNALVLNAPLTLYRAARIRAKETDIGADPLVGVRRLGFASLEEAARVAGLPSGEPEQVRAALFPVAPGQPRALAQSPHVVMGLLESFGQDLLFSDGPGNDLLGRLRAELAYGHRFDNFISGQNGTHPQLENLLLGSPITPLTGGRNARLSFDTSAALPFKRAGYRTVFLYGGGSDWREIGTAFTRQGFDRVYDARDIRARFADAHGTDWGLYDAWLFRFAEDLLVQADAKGERLFLVLLTTTNHPPFELDTPRRNLPLDPAALGPRALDDKAELRSMLATYQYQADEFGGFVQTLRQGPLGERTIIAAAGDHNLRTHYRYDLPAEQPDVDRVFAWLRVPDAYAPAGAGPDTRAFAGHADLIPTLVSLAVPGQRYFATGRNLWQAPGDGGQALAQFDRMYTAEGMLMPLHAPLLHAWHSPRQVRPEGTVPDAAATVSARRAAAGVALRDWYIRDQVLRVRK
ncbi:LTA synthase family protein [Stenotrophomonas sp. SY1]|uniref:LTA synthase family protein n=1 Tax=Stenotrophomonas sp. SY1 TaxID=477235 RepID=UPI001E29D0FE|nr:LTA synthase family protein [Stenotrophomonas sp. SY1]MCD9087941.1 LTA synthase family protein [Stenotrophomonas sp. SY1]